MTTRNASPKLLLSRPLDAVWTVWFAIHLVIMFSVDMVGIYPTWLAPTPLLSLRRWYIATYHDRFFVAPPAWFNLFIYLEAAYHVPLSIWAIGALRKDHPLVPLNLLVWSVETFITTLVCVVDIIFWPGATASEVWSLCGLYVPYCLLSLVIGIDMFVRLSRKLCQQPSLKQE